MASNSVPFRPFSFQADDSQKYISGRATDVPITTRQPSPHFAANYESKKRPSIPGRNTQPSQASTRSQESMKREAVKLYGNSQQSEPTVQRIHSLTTLQHSQPSSPTPPMTKSSHKILQLTGFDARFEQALSTGHQQIAPPIQLQQPPSPSSSSSLYSQSKAGLRHERTDLNSAPSKDSVEQNTRSEELLAPSIYSVSEQSSQVSQPLKAKQSPPVTPLPAAKTPQFLQPPVERPKLLSRHSDPAFDPKDVISLPEILEQGKGRHGRDSQRNPSTDQQASRSSVMPLMYNPPLVPAPLTLRPKPNALPIHIHPTKKPSLLASARSSLQWGIYDLTSPRDSKYCRPPISPISPMYSMESDHLQLSPPLGSPSPTSSRSKKRRFGAGAKHPLKSPFPFTIVHPHLKPYPGPEEDEEDDVVPSPSSSRKFTHRVSDTIKSLSPTMSHSSNNNSPTSNPSPTSLKRTVISNKARKADGPATPIPQKSSFLEFTKVTAVEGLGRVKETVMGKSREEKAAEKKRESLKKRIVVVGIADQSPDGRVAEWL